MRTQLWALAALVGVAQAAGAATLTFVGKTTDVTDFQAAGFGTAGYWFPQFGAASPVTDADYDNNDRNALPAWLGVTFPQNRFDDGKSFDEVSFTRGGEPAWNTFTLPDGEIGLSGSVVDPTTDNNSNNTIKGIEILANAPPSFLFSIVVDNTNGEHDPAGRLRVRDFIGGNIDLTPPGPPGSFNGIADVYTFRFDGYAALSGDPAVPFNGFRVQFNSGVDGIDGGFAGLMFDAIPEPGAGLLAALGVLAASLRPCSRG